MESKKAVGIWIRVSTEDQAKGESPEHHEKRARLYAEAKGWDVKVVYHLDALSGKSVMNYPQTKQMLADIREKKITGLVFSNLPAWRVIRKNCLSLQICSVKKMRT